MDDSNELETSPHRIWERAVNLPGAVAAVFILSMILPPLGIFPAEITTTLLIGFTMPALLVFLVNVGFNRNIVKGVSMIVVMACSYAFYLILKWPFSIHGFTSYSLIFIVGLTVSTNALLIYYVCYRLGKKFGQDSYRLRFFTAFLPTVIIMIPVSIILASLFSEWIALSVQGMVT